MAIIKTPILDGSGKIVDASLPTRLGAGELSAAYGPTATPMLNKFSLKRAYYPESYGADPTGVADSRNGIQGAIDAASTAGGGVVVIGGTYRVDSSLEPKDNVILQGLGWGISQLIPSASWPDGASIIQLGGTTGNPCENFFVRDIKFDMTNVLTARKGKALFVTYMRNLRFENNWVLNSTATGIGADFLDASVIRGNRVEGCGRFAAGSEETILGCSGIGIGTGAWGSEATLVENNFVINPVRYGIFVESQGGISNYFTYGVKILNNYITGAYRGIGSDGVAYDHIIGNHIEASRQDGIVISPGNAGGSSYGTTVAQNTVRTSTRYGMLIDFTASGNGSPTESGKFKISDNQFVFNTGVGLKIVTSAQMKGFQICNNRISENGSIGLDITGGGLLESDVIDNRITDNTGVGIRVLGACLRVAIRGNRSGDTRAAGRTQVSGLQLSSVMTDSVIEGNDFRNTTGAALDAATAPVNSKIRNNNGHNPQGTDTLAVTASPMTYTVGPTPENLYIIGGTWTTVSLNGVNVATTAPSVVMAQPNDVVVFTYTATPTAIKRHKI
jgi:hypothetical protein